MKRKVIIASIILLVVFALFICYNAFNRRAAYTVFPIDDDFVPRTFTTQQEAEQFSEVLSGVGVESVIEKAETL